MIARLLEADRKNILRDPTYLFLLLAPLLIGLVVRFGIPLLTAFVLETFGVDLSPWTGMMYAFFLQLPAYLAGLMTGMLLLEERDEGVLSAWAATPLGRSGYILYRTAFAFAAACIAELLLLLFIPGAGAVVGSGFITVLRGVPMIAAFSGGAPLILLLLALFARDKVSGLAMAKLTGVVLALPLLLLLPEDVPGRVLIHLLYPVLNTRAFFEFRSGSGAGLLLFCVGSIVLQGALVLAGTRTLVSAPVLPLRPGRRSPRAG